MKSIYFALWFILHSSNAFGDQHVLLGEQTYFLRNGKVYEQTRSSEDAREVGNSSRVIDLLIFQDSLFALRANGDVYLLAQRDNRPSAWLWMGNNTAKLVATDNDLFALTGNSQVWILEYAPQLMIASHYNEEPASSFDIPILVIYRVAFGDLRVRGVTNLVLREDGNAYAVFRDGTEIPMPSLQKTQRSN